MGDKTGIEWADATWNPIVGCSIVSPGCTNCYAMKQAARIERMTAGENRIRAEPQGFNRSGRLVQIQSHYSGTTQSSKSGPVWTGKVALAPDHILTAPLRWKRPRRIFVNSMGDLFHESVPDTWIDQLFAVMVATKHTFLVLTKRSSRMREYVSMISDMTGEAIAKRFAHANLSTLSMMPAFIEWPLANCWLGVSCEDQRRADERVPDLLATPAAVRFVSAEPLLGPIRFWYPDEEECAWRGCGVKVSGGMSVGTPDNPPEGYDDSQPYVDWIITGGESGPDARPMLKSWATSIRDQCAAAHVPFFFKQWGEFKDGSDFAPDAIAVTSDGRVVDPTPDALAAADRISRIGNATMMRRVGKKRAGRMLDGRTHDAFPESSPDA